MSVAADPLGASPLNGQTVSISSQPLAQPKAGDVRFDSSKKLFLMTLNDGSEISIHKLHGVELNENTMNTDAKIADTIKAIKGHSAAIRGALEGTKLGAGMHTITFENNYQTSKITDETGKSIEKKLSLSPGQIKTIQAALPIIKRIGEQSRTSNPAAAHAHAGLAPNTSAAIQVSRPAIPARPRKKSAPPSPSQHQPAGAMGVPASSGPSHAPPLMAIAVPLDAPANPQPKLVAATSQGGSVPGSPTASPQVKARGLKLMQETSGIKEILRAMEEPTTPAQAKSQVAAINLQQQALEQRAQSIRAQIQEGMPESDRKILIQTLGVIQKTIDEANGMLERRTEYLNQPQPS